MSTAVDRRIIQHPGQIDEKWSFEQPRITADFKEISPKNDAFES